MQTTDIRCKNHDFDPLWGAYTIDKFIGSGTSSAAFELSSKNDGRKHVGLFPKCEHMGSAVLLTIESNIRYGKMVQGAPNIMQLNDVVCFKGLPVPIFSKCAGSPLKFLREGANKCLKLSSREIKSIMKQAFEAVKFLMTAGGSGLWHSGNKSPTRSR